MTISYLSFDFLVFLIPIVVLALVNRSSLSTRRLSVFGSLIVLTVVYATPWDNYLVSRGVWTYGSGVVYFRLGHVPLGEYAVFILQPLLIGLWFTHLDPNIEASVGTAPFPSRPVGSGVGFALALAGGALLTIESGYYLGALLIWITPVLGLEWAFGGPALWRYRRVQLSAMALPTLYLWLADAAAIHLGVWTVAEKTALGLAVGGLPIEELVFFALTNLLLVHGLVLIHWTDARIDASTS